MNIANGIAPFLSNITAVLASRIDRLPAAHKDLLQTLVVMGRESPFALIRNVTSLAEGEAERMLLGLQATEFIYEQPALTEVQYAFLSSSYRRRQGCRFRRNIHRLLIRPVQPVHHQTDGLQRYAVPFGLGHRKLRRHVEP